MWMCIGKALDNQGCACERVWVDVGENVGEDMWVESV
jgi:hypothetical protein